MYIYRRIIILLIVPCVIFTISECAYAKVLTPPVDPNVQVGASNVFDEMMGIPKQEGWEAGKFLFDQGSIEKSVAFLRQYVMANPKSAHGWYWLGRGLEVLGDFEGAQLSFQRVVAIDPFYPALANPLKKQIVALAQRDPHAPPRLLSEAKTISVECESSRSGRSKVESFAAAVSREIQNRLSRVMNMTVVDSTFAPELSQQADLMIVVATNTGGKLDGTMSGAPSPEVPLGVNIRITDNFSRQIVWGETIWLSTVISSPNLDSLNNRILAVARTVDRLMELWDLSNPHLPQKRIAESEKDLMKMGIEALVAKVENSGEKIILDGGVDKKLYDGQKFMVYRFGQPIVSPTDARVIGFDENILAYGQITGVREQMSYAKITKFIRKDIAVGDRIRLYWENL